MIHSHAENIFKIAALAKQFKPNSWITYSQEETINIKTVDGSMVSFLNHTHNSNYESVDTIIYPFSSHSMTNNTVPKLIGPSNKTYFLDGWTNVNSVLSGLYLGTDSNPITKDDYTMDPNNLLDSNTNITIGNSTYNGKVNSNNNFELTQTFAITNNGESDITITKFYYFFPIYHKKNNSNFWKNCLIATEQLSSPVTIPPSQTATFQIHGVYPLSN